MIHDIFYFLFCKVAESQSSPSYKPSPVVAQHAWMYHCLCLKPCSPSLSVIAAALIALGRSCLLANTSNTESLNSSSLSILWSSSRADNDGKVRLKMSLRLREREREWKRESRKRDEWKKKWKKEKGWEMHQSGPCKWIKLYGLNLLDDPKVPKKEKKIAQEKRRDSGGH